MKTQIVYVLVSSPHDLFLDQLWGSIYSLRHFHPTAKVVVLADDHTTKRIKTDDKLRPLYSMISELKEIPVPEEYKGALRSREIKTRVRNLIDGDFLYIDTDTIIVQPLDSIDSLDVKNIAMVPDTHRPTAKDNLLSNVNRMEMLYGLDKIDDNAIYFNAGVTFVRDNPLTRDFFDKWHENWLTTVNKGYIIDQPALFYTDKTFGYIIEKLPDTYNCMGVYAASYWADAKIIHYLDTQYSIPFRLLKAIPEKIHQAHAVTEEVEDLLLNAKSRLSIHTCFCSYYDLVFLKSSFFQFCMRNKLIRWCILKHNKWAVAKHIITRNRWK